MSTIPTIVLLVQRYDLRWILMSLDLAVLRSNTVVVSFTYLRVANTKFIIAEIEFDVNGRAGGTGLCYRAK